MFIATLFTIGTLFTNTVIKKNEVLSFGTTQMDLEGTMLNEVSQKMQILHDFTYKWNPTKQNKTIPRVLDTVSTVVTARQGGDAGGMQWVKGVKRYKLPVIKCMSQGYNAQSIISY